MLYVVLFNFTGEYFMKKIALMAMLSTGAGLFAADTAGAPATPEPIPNAQAYQTVVDQKAGSIDQVLQGVQANPRQNLARRPSVAALNSFNVYDPGSATPREVGVVHKAGDATAILRNMLKDGMADFAKLTGLYFSNDITKDLPVIPTVTKDETMGTFSVNVPTANAMPGATNGLQYSMNSLAEKVARVGGYIARTGDYGYVIKLPDYDPTSTVGVPQLYGSVFEDLVKEAVNINVSLRLDLANNGIDPR